MQPQRPTYIYFHKVDGTLAHKVDVATVTGYPQGSLSRTLTFNPNFSFTEKEYYYVLLDPGKHFSSLCRVNMLELSKVQIKMFHFLVSSQESTDTFLV